MAPLGVLDVGQQPRAQLAAVRRQQRRHRVALEARRHVLQRRVGHVVHAAGIAHPSVLAVVDLNLHVPAAPSFRRARDRDTGGTWWSRLDAAVRVRAVRRASSSPAVTALMLLMPRSVGQPALRRDHLVEQRLRLRAFFGDHRRRSAAAESSRARRRGSGRTGGQTAGRAGRRVRPSNASSRASLLEVRRQQIEVVDRESSRTGRIRRRAAAARRPTRCRRARPTRRRA